MTKPNLLDYVPPEIWTIIFDKLQIPVLLNNAARSLYQSDLYNCYKSCTAFRNILESTKPSWIFIEVIQYISSCLTTSEILLCRCICKSWKYAIDTFLENQHGASLRTRNCRVNCSFTTSERVLRFADNFKNHSGNPFPARDLTLAYEWDGNDPRNRNAYDEFWNLSTVQILHTYGHNLTKLRLKFRFKGHEWNLHSLATLSSCLKETPNLRDLHLDGYSPSHRAVALHMDYYESVWLPTLPHLEYLEFSPGRCSAHNNCNVIPLAVQCSIGRQYFQQLRRLQISFTESPETTLDSFQIRVPHLQELCVKIMYVHQLKSILEQNGYPLKHLRSISVEIVSLKTFITNQVNALVDILILLVKYKESLCELDMSADEYKSTNILSSHSAIAILKEFKGLEYLRIRGYYFCRLHITNCLPQRLHYLHVCANKWSDYDYECYVSRDLRQNDLTTWSDVWESFPHLRWIRVDNGGSSRMPTRHTLAYRRETWEWWFKLNMASRVKTKFEGDDTENGNEFILFAILIGFMPLVFMLIVLFCLGYV